jgi:hypothetical protein
MADGGGLQSCSGARGKRNGEFYKRVEAVLPHRRVLQELQHGHRAAATCGGSRRPMGNGGSPAGECAPAAWNQPRPPRKRHDL